jgi:hypothetical protein
MSTAARKARVLTASGLQDVDLAGLAKVLAGLSVGHLQKNDYTDLAERVRPFNSFAWFLAMFLLLFASAVAILTYSWRRR